MATHLPGKSHVQRNLAGYSPLGSQRVRHNLATKQQQLHIYAQSIASFNTVLSAARLSALLKDNERAELQAQ